MRYYRHNQYSPPKVGLQGLGERIEKLSKEELDEKSKKFIESLSEYFRMNGCITQNQYSYFESIESRFSPAEKAKLASWASEYKTKHSADARILGEYYTRVGYYSGIAPSIHADHSFIPPRGSFERMINNKYAKKILTAIKAEPKFSVDDLVQLRGTAGNSATDSHLRNMRHRLCFVLSNTAPVINAVNGAKRYKVLPMGHSEPIFVEERHIMKPNKKGKTN